MCLIGEVARISDIMQPFHDIVPIDRAKIRKQMLIRYSVIILNMSRLQPASEYTKRISLRHALYMTMTRVPTSTEQRMIQLID